MEMDPEVQNKNSQNEEVYGEFTYSRYLLDFAPEGRTSMSSTNCCCLADFEGHGLTNVLRRLMMRSRNATLGTWCASKAAGAWLAGLHVCAHCRPCVSCRCCGERHCVARAKTFEHFQRRRRLVCRPLSKRKAFTVSEIMQRARVYEGIATPVPGQASQPTPATSMSTPSRGFAASAILSHRTYSC